MVAIGYLLIIVGLVLILLGVLKWLGVITATRAAAGAGPWDFLIALLDKAPWVVVVGLILIYIGCKMAGVPLPF